MVLINLLTLLLLAGSSSLSHAGTLRAKKGLSAGMGGPGKGATAGKGAKAPGKGAETTPTPTPTTTPTPTPPPPSAVLGATGNTSQCGVQPPSITGGCSVACEFGKVAEAGAQAVLGEIPVVGNFVSNLVGIFWPNDDALTDTAVLQDAVNYINAMIVQVENEIFTEDLYEKYQKLVADVQYLSSLIKGPTEGRYIWLTQTILRTDCVNLNIAIGDMFKWLQGQLDAGNQTQVGANPIALVTFIGNVGQACLAMRYVEIYEGNTTYDYVPSNTTVNMSKATLDSWVQNYTTWAQTATKLAVDWRQAQINVVDQKCHADDDGGTVCGTLNEELVLGLSDNVCYAWGGPPPDMGFVVGDTAGKCVCSNTDLATNTFKSFIPYYKQIVLQGFTDNLVSASRSLVPLWKYQTSESIDAGIKPSPVIRAATSLIDSYLPVALQVEGERTFTFPDTEMQNIYSVYNGDTSSGQRTDRISQIRVQYTGNFVFKVEVSQVVGGQSTTLELGRPWDENDDEYPDVNIDGLILADNERIVAVGAFNCGDAECPMQGFAFKTAHVNASGAFESDGQIWNPFGYPEDGPWIVAPPLAQARNASFLPHVIAFNGWATQDSNENFMVGAKIPVWLYESLE